MQEEGKAKQRYVEAVEKAKAELDENHSIQGKKAFDELRTEHFNFLNNLKQAALAQEKGKLVNYLFEKALSRLGSLEVPNKPSLFVVYAHENKAYGKAEASTSKYLIEKLSQIQVVLYSDQTPIGQPYSSVVGEVKKDSKLEDILTNQLCLLPGQLRSDVKPVDKVVVCCSEVLGNYLKWPEYDSFYQKLREAYGKDREAYFKGDEQGNAWAIREVVREFSQGEKYKAGFHHVLTEMAFLQVRAEQLKDGHGIIPVPLTRNSYDDCLSHFISATTVRMGDIPRFEEQAQAGREVYPNQSQHWVLFKLLERLIVGSDEAKLLLNKFWMGYEDCISWLKNELSTPSELEFVKLVDRIFDEIERALQKQLVSTVQQVYPAWQQVGTRLLDQSRDLAQIQTGIDSLVARLLGNLWENIQKLKLNYLEDLEKDREIKDALANYVSPEGMLMHDSERFLLEGRVQEFLNSDKRTLLLLGEAGSGKSTFNRHLAVSLWEACSQKTNTENVPIPVFIGLSSQSGSNQNLVNAFFETQGFSKEQIKELQTKHRLVLILDGFDEIEHRQQVFYRDNQLNAWKEAKIIISSRPEYLGPNYQYKFHPSSERSALQEYRLAPFSEETIKRYIDRYTEMHPYALWSTEKYKKELEEPSLKELVSNPFLLKITLSVLPELSEALQAEGKKFTRIKIYDQFVKSWFDRSQQRLDQILELNSKEREEFKKLERGGFADFGVEFSQELALEMYQAGEIVTHYQAVAYAKWKKNSPITERDWRRRLLGDEETSTMLMRLNAPLIYQDRPNDLGKEYRFVHKSLQDYFVARVLWEELNPRKELEISSWLNRLDIVSDPAILQFLTERMQQDGQLKEKLLGVVNSSKEKAELARGAANAITVLVKAGVKFNGMDLQGIRIAGADLSYGIFDLVHLQGADLTGVKLQGAWLRGVNFTEAEMAGVEFGERICLQMRNPVSTCCYSPDGRWLAVVDGDGIHLYGSSHLHPISTADKDRHQDFVQSIAISSDGKWLASGSHDKTVKLWYIAEGKLCLADTGIGHDGGVFSIAISSGGKWLASGSADKTVRLWRIEENKLRLVDADTIIKHEDYLLHLAISPNDQWVAASGSGDKKLSLWRIEKGNLHLINRHKIPQDSPTSVAFSSDSQWLASGSYDGKVELWSVDGEKFTLVHTYEGHQGVVCSVAFSLDGQWLASGGVDRKVKLWRLKGKLTLEQVYPGHDNTVLSVTFSPDNSQLASGDMDGTVKFWALEEGDHDQISNTNESYEASVSSIECSSDGKLLVSGNQEGNIKVWLVKEGQYSLIGIYRDYRKHNWVSSLAMSLDGEWLVSGNTDKTVKLWRVEEGKLCRADSHIGHEGVVWSVAISSNGEWLASGSQDKTMKLWRMEKGKLSLADIGTEHQDEVKSVAISLDGKLLASGSWDKTILWRIEEGRLNLVNTSIEHQDIVPTSVVFSPDGEWLILGSKDRTVKLWSTATGKLVHTYTGHQGPVIGLKVSPDGKWIASIGWERTMKLWSLTEPRRCHTTLEGWKVDIRRFAWQTSAENSIKLVLAGAASIYSFRLDKNKEGWQDKLEWISHQSVLNAFGAKIAKGLNLSEMNTQLLIQKGANQVFIQGLENQMHQCQKRLQEIMDKDLVSILSFSKDLAQIIANHVNDCVNVMKDCVNLMDKCLDEIQKDKLLKGLIYSPSTTDWMCQFERGFKTFDRTVDILKELKNVYGDFKSQPFPGV